MIVLCVTLNGLLIVCFQFMFDSEHLWYWYFFQDVVCASTMKKSSENTSRESHLSESRWFKCCEDNICVDQKTNYKGLSKTK
jgi:hypothetical protein